MDNVQPCYNLETIADIQLEANSQYIFEVCDFNSPSRALPYKVIWMVWILR